MKKKIHFGELNIGDSFEYAGKEYTKVTDRRGLSLNPRNEAIFDRANTVRIDVLDDDDFYPMFGITGSGSGNPNFGSPPFVPGSSGGWGQSSGNSTGSSRGQGTVAGTGMTAEEIEDFYGVGVGDTCNF